MNNWIQKEKKVSEYISSQYNTKANPQLKLIDKRKNKLNTFA